MAVTSSIDIETVLKDGRTILQKGRAEHPYKVADITEERRDNLLRLMLMCSSPGMLDGDHTTINIAVNAGCRLELQTQSYQRLFTMTNRAAQQMHLDMQAGTSFIYLPHPVVPHRRSDFNARNTIRISAGHELLWGEVLTCGRKLNGEIFTLTRYHAVTEIFLSSRLVLRENLLLQPAAFSSLGTGHLEGYTHQATLIYLHDEVPVKRLLAEVRHMISGMHGITGGITPAPVNGIVLRLLGHKAEQLHDSLKTIGARLLAITQDHICNHTHPPVSCNLR